MQLGGELGKIAANIALELPLVYTCNKSCIGERDKNAPKIAFVNGRLHFVHNAKTFSESILVVELSNFACILMLFTCASRWNNIQSKGSDGMVRMVKRTIHSQLFLFSICEHVPSQLSKSK